MKKNIVLVGGSYGIGYEVAKQMSEFHNVYVASRTNEYLERENIKHITFDVLADDLSAISLPDTIDGFVFCPGSINLKPLKMLTIDAFRQDMELNFFALVSAVKAILPKMSEGASMVFFSTVAVNTGMPFHTSVSSAKGAIEGFAKSLAAENAPKIRVNVIAPSLVDTPLAKRLLNNDKKKEMMAARHPLKRVGNVNDIANMVTFLLNPENSWISGQVIQIDGGMSSLNVN
ncbi:SDR family NAD(P)-dependent oxidoreductase [Flagellimonas meridianipacifica]|uniref:NAD(P)-dependent dehydrogenase (Short-subunit alcohol dehydrogenase family) n=1 Tax=Flagellimonas meridianipacifica TaxID=1080225 RepID=A0A2T0MCH1_9FLAO|nr:SDR family oxidoreductase [Allomuricauda pacifica]PRX55198.1 NAD(P)-dependent dehydrogenase (short-subunit alcohol dehydrogenase family) [Allomuricauda pacifica]